MTHNPSFTNLPWASFTSFRLPPFASFINSNHSYIRAESPVEPEEGRDSPPLSNESFPSPYEDHRQSRSPDHLNPKTLQSSTRPDPVRSPPSSGQIYVSPIVFQPPSTPSHASHHTRSRSTSPQSPVPHLASPSNDNNQPAQSSHVSLQDRPVLSPRKLSNLTVSINEPSFAGPFTRRYAPPISAPSPVSARPESHPFPGAGTALEPYLVDWLPGEPANPYNWNKRFKWILTVHLALNCLCPVFATSSYVGAIESVLVQFPQTSEEVALLGLSLFLLGMGFGSLLWGPLSEIVGRRQAFLVSFPFFVLFTLAAAVAKNVSTILAVRLLAGVFGAAQLPNMGGQMIDMWTPAERVVPAGLSALAPLLGPVLGPIVCGFVGEKGGFRAVFWVNFGFGCACLVGWFFFVPETSAPILLRRKAQQLQRKADKAGTGEQFVSKYEPTKKLTKEIIKFGLATPFRILFTEVICLMMTLYMSMIYGILYILFTAFPIIFQTLRGWSLGLAGLALIGIGIGMVIGFGTGRFQISNYLKARARIPAHDRVPPEIRLPLMCIGAIMIPISLFGFAWTSTPNIHWIVPILFSLPFGTAYVMVFNAMLLYLIDCYEIYTASVLAANSFMRFAFGATFPLFVPRLYGSLGTHWAGTLLAFLSVLMAPVPFLFLRFGPRLRRNSKFVPSTGLGRSALQPLITLQIEEKRNMQSPSSGSGGTTAVSSQPPRGIHDTIPSFRSPNPSPTPSRSHTPQPQISGDISVFSAPMETGRRAATRQGEQTTTYGRGYSRGYGDEDFQQREEDEADVGMTERGPLM